MYFSSFFPSFSKTLVLLVWLCHPKLLLACSSLDSVWLIYLLVLLLLSHHHHHHHHHHHNLQQQQQQWFPLQCTACSQNAIFVCFSDNCNQSCRFCCQTNWLYRQASAHLVYQYTHQNIKIGHSAARYWTGREACVLFHFPPVRWEKFGIVVIRKWIPSL